MTEKNNNFKSSSQLNELSEFVSEFFAAAGFIRSGMIWRRYFPTLMQQFGFERPPRQKNCLKVYWGINLGSYSIKDHFKVYDIEITWDDSWAVDRYLSGRFKLHEVLSLNSTLSWDKRCEYIKVYVNELVMPAFNIYQDVDSVRRMVINEQSPYRAQLFGNVPIKWLPQSMQERVKNQAWYKDRLLEDELRIRNGMTRKLQ